MTYKEANVGDYLLWDGRLVRVISTCTGEKMIGMEYLDKPKCQKCGQEYDEQFDVVEASPLFQESAKPIKTIKEGQE